jgi:RNA polymerase sigma-70 factor (ECF subfamily)
MIRRCQDGDLDAFNELILHHQQYAFSVAIHLLCDEQDARDAVQETFLRVWEHFHRYEPERKFTTWLYTIVTNVCLDRLRHRKRWQRLFATGVADGEVEDLPEEQDLSTLHSNRELCAIIRTLTDQLPPKQRLVFVLRDLEDLPVEEVATISGMSEASVKTNLHLARRRLRSLLARDYAVERS